MNKVSTELSLPVGGMAKTTKDPNCNNQQLFFKHALIDLLRLKQKIKLLANYMCLHSSDKSLSRSN